jgi:hypothetical protein
VLYVVLKPDKTPLPAPYLSMGDAQAAIAEIEPDVIAQCGYQIHPLESAQDAERLKIKIQVDWKLEKFDGEYVGQAPTETLEGTFDGTH